MPNNELRNPALESAAKSGAVGAQGGPIDPDLQALIDAWPALPKATRQSILAMVREAAAGADAEGTVE